MPFPVFVLISASIAASTAFAATALRRWTWLAVLVALAGATALLLFHGLVYLDYYADDSFITLRYSKHLADGLGPNWNSDGTHVEGYTNFLWMVLLAALGKLHVDIVAASRILGGLSLVGTFVSVWLIWRLWQRDDDEGALRSPALLTAAILGLALTDGVAFWGFSGMETPLFMMLVTLSAYCYMRERRGGLIPWSAAPLAAAAMTRPDGVFAIAVTGAFVLADAMQSRRREDVGRAVLWGGLLLMLYGSYFVWRYTYYGYLFPNTYYAKVGYTAASLQRGMNHIQQSGLQYHLLALFTGAVMLAGNLRLRRDAVYIVVLTAAMLGAVVLEGNESTHARFIVPVMPLLLIGGLSGFALLVRRANLTPMHTTALASLSLSLGALALLPASYDQLLPFNRQMLEQRQALGTWFNENTPPDYTIADFAIGATSYYASDRPFLDLLGLNDVTIAHTHVANMGSGISGHEKYNLDYVLDDVRPEIIVSGQVWYEPLTTDQVHWIAAQPNALMPVQALMRDDRLWQEYQARAVKLGDVWFHFLQRKDTVAELRAPDLR